MALSGCGAFNSEAFDCDCDTYDIYAISRWGNSDMYLFTNEAGQFCVKDSDNANGADF